MRGIPVHENGHPWRRTFVLAGSHSQFMDWCYRSHVNPRSPAIRYLHDDQQLRGVKDLDLVYAGTWEERPYREVREVLLALDVLRALGAIRKTYHHSEIYDIEPDIQEA